MGNRKQFGSRIDGGEIEFVAKNPKDHPLVYVKAVREACYRRYLRAPGRDKPPLRYSLRLLDQAIARWGEALSAHPHASDCDKQGEAKCPECGGSGSIEIDDGHFIKCKCAAAIRPAEQAATLLASGYVQNEAAIPDGYALVPIKPTSSMIEAGCEHNPTQWNEGTDMGFAADVANDVYVSMVNAAIRSARDGGSES